MLDCLSAADLVAASCTCRVLRELAGAQPVWQRLFLTRSGMAPAASRQGRDLCWEASLRCIQGFK